MKRITFSLLLIAQASFGAATYYIEPGTTSFGAGRGALSSRVTVSLTGAPSSQQRIFNYFDFSGTLSIALPPGVTGTCTGAPCNIFTGESNGNGVYGDMGTMPTSGSYNAYTVDPVWASTAAACSSSATTNLYGSSVP